MSKALDKYGKNIQQINVAIICLQCIFIKADKNYSVIFILILKGLCTVDQGVFFPVSVEQIRLLKFPCNELFYMYLLSLLCILHARLIHRYYSDI